MSTEKQITVPFTKDIDTHNCESSEAAFSNTNQQQYSSCRRVVG